MMVSSNRGYPESENPSADLSPSEEIIMVTDTDTDEDENVYNYQLLPTDEVQEVNDGENTESEGAVTLESNESLPPITRMDETLIKEVWCGPTPQAVEIKMDNDKIDEVKKAMMNFSLPSSSIPEWAFNIPEEQWKQQLIQKLQLLQKK